MPLWRCAPLTSISRRRSRTSFSFMAIPRLFEPVSHGAPGSNAARVCVGRGIRGCASMGSVLWGADLLVGEDRGQEQGDEPCCNECENSVRLHDCLRDHLVSSTVLSVRVVCNSGVTGASELNFKRNIRRLR